MNRLALAAAASLAVVVPALSAGAAPVRAPRPPDGTYRYQIRVGGDPFGTGVVLFRGGPDGVTVDDNTRFDAQRLHAHVVARYAADTLAPVAYVATVTSPLDAQHIELSFEPGRVVIHAADEDTPVAADPSAPLELISDNFVGTLVVVPAIVHASKVSRFTMAALGGAKATVAVVVAGASPRRPSGLPPADVSLVIDLGAVRDELWYDPATMVVDAIELPEQHADVRRIMP